MLLLLWILSSLVMPAFAEAILVDISEVQSSTIFRRGRPKIFEVGDFYNVGHS